jgi:hypothetical protein
MILRMMVVLIVAALWLYHTVFVANAQNGLIADRPVISEQVDVYGQPVQIASGTLRNISNHDFANITLTATVYDDADTVIGEGIGVLVDSCLAGLPFDYVMPTLHDQPYSIPLELYESDSVIDRVEVNASGDEMPASFRTALSPAIQPISDREVVMAEWNGSEILRYAVGCPRDMAHEWEWHSFNLLSENDRLVEYPFAALITPQLRETLRLTDEAIYQNSRLTIAPSGTRLIFQDAVNRFFTGSINGMAQRLLHGNMNSYFLQGVQWLEGDRFLVYYYGAYGDPVIYSTADAEGRAISPHPLNNRRSVIVPGASADGRRVIIAGTYPDETQTVRTGYFIRVLTSNFFELLFEAEPPGNNYPAPIPLVNVAEDRVYRVYVVRDVDSVPTLSCYNRDTAVLHDLAPVPLALTESDHSGMWLSEDHSTIALGATGANGGLWLIDLTALAEC